MKCNFNRLISQAITYTIPCSKKKTREKSYNWSSPRYVRDYRLSPIFREIRDRRVTSKTLNKEKFSINGKITLSVSLQDSH